MEWLKISTSTELVRIQTEDIVFVQADGNYSDLYLFNGKPHKMTFKSFVVSTNIAVKQTITFKDGNTIELYYQKKGDVCKLYSTTDVTKYKESDLSKIKSTNIEFVDKVEGKCYITRKTNDVIAFAKSVLKQLV